MGDDDYADECEIRAFYGLPPLDDATLAAAEALRKRTEIEISPLDEYETVLMVLAQFNDDEWLAHMRRREARVADRRALLDLLAVHDADADEAKPSWGEDDAEAEIVGEQLILPLVMAPAAPPSSRVALLAR